MSAIEHAGAFALDVYVCTRLGNTGSVIPIEPRHRLRIAREATGMSKSAFAARLGISRNTVSAVERGIIPCRPLLLEAWASACGVPTSEITGLPRLESNQQPSDSRFSVTA